MTIRGRIIVLGYLAVGGLLLSILSWHGLEIVRYLRLDSARAEIAAAAPLSTLIHELQRERGVSAGHVADPGPRSRVILEGERRRTDRTADRVRELAPDLWPPAMGALLADLRMRIDAGAVDGGDVHAVYSALILDLLDHIALLAGTVGLEAVKGALLAHSHLLLLKEHLGQVRATVNRVLSHNNGLDGRTRADLARIEALFDEFLRQFRRDAPARSLELFDRHFAGDDVETAIKAMRMARREGRLPPELTAEEWFALSSRAIDRLRLVEIHSLEAIALAAEQNSRNIVTRLLVNTIALTMVGVVIFALTWASVRSVLSAFGGLLGNIDDVIGSRKFDRRIPARRSDEIGTIARRLNELLETVERLLREKDLLASTDMLTGVANRRRFSETLSLELARKRRHPGPLSLIMFDIDRFKSINDTFGHDVGDETIKGIAALVAAHIRRADLFARWGGEEFVILLPDDPLKAAVELAEKLRTIVAGHDFGQAGRVTASFGVSGLIEDDDGDGLIKRADEALYDAKRQGRNQVRFLSRPDGTEACGTEA